MFPLTIWLLGLVCACDVVLPGKADASGVEFLLNLGNFGGLDVCGGRFCELIDRDFPLSRSKADASSLFVEIAEVVMNSGVGLAALNSLTEIGFSEFELTELEIGPSE